MSRRFRSGLLFAGGCDRCGGRFVQSRLAENPGQGAAAATEFVDACRDGRILLDWRRVMRLEPRVDHERPSTAPVLLVHRRIDAMDVGRGV